MFNASSILEKSKYEYEVILCKPNKQQICFIDYYDISYNPIFLEYNKLNFSIYREIVDEYGNSKINPSWGMIFSDYLALLNIKVDNEIISSEYFVIESPNLTYDSLDNLTFDCYSYEKVFLNNENLHGFRDTEKHDSVKKLYDPLNEIDDDGKPKGVLNYILDMKFNNCWTLRHIDDSILERERVINFSGNNLKYVIDTLSESFNCVFVFDNVNMIIDVYEREIGMLGENKGLVIADDNYMSKITYQEDTTNIKTRVYVFGKNQSTIAKYNPTGQMYVDDFSYYMNLRYMSQGLIDALIKYNALVESKKGVFTEYVDRLDNGDTSVDSLIDALIVELDWKNNFTIGQIKEITPFIKEETVTINTISDGRELYKYALRYLKTACFIPIQISVDIIDIFAMEASKSDWTKLKIGDFANIYRKEFDLEYKEMRLISYEHNPIQNSLRLEFSNKDEFVTRQWLDNMFFKYIENMQIEFDYNQDLYTVVPDIDTPEIVQKVEDMMDGVVSDVVNNAITDVFETDVLSAETAMILNAWIRYLLVEYLETNFEAIDMRLPPPPNMQRNFVRIHDQCIQFLCSELASSSEGEEDDSTENYVTPYGDQIYWSAIDDHPQAYKYFTITDPLSVHKVNIPKGSTKEQIEKLQNELREKYRVKVRKADKTYGRLSIEFDEEHEFKIPRMVWGTGDESGNGKGFIYKEGDGMYLTYTTRVDVGKVTTGTEIGLKVTDEGTWFYDIKNGEWKLIGSGGGNGDFIILDHIPTQEETDSYEDNTLIFVYDPTGEKAKFGESAYDIAKRLATSEA